MPTKRSKPKTRDSPYNRSTPKNQPKPSQRTQHSPAPYSFQECTQCFPRSTTTSRNGLAGNNQVVPVRLRSLPVPKMPTLTTLPPTGRTNFTPRTDRKYSREPPRPKTPLTLQDHLPTRIFVNKDRQRRPTTEFTPYRPDTTEKSPFHSEIYNKPKNHFKAPPFADITDPWETRSEDMILAERELNGAFTILRYIKQLDKNTSRFMLPADYYRDLEGARRHVKIIQNTHTATGKLTLNYCSYCRTNGHGLNFCKKLVEKRTILRHFPFFCFYCRSLDHDIDNCPTAKLLRCSGCLESGHHVKFCKKSTY